MNDEYAPIARKFYEAAAHLINQFEPFTREEVLFLLENECDDIECLNALLEYGHIDRRLYEEVIELIDEMGACPEDQLLELGFVFDLFLCWWKEVQSVVLE